MVNDYLPLLFLALGIAGVIGIVVGGIVLILVLVGVI